MYVSIHGLTGCSHWYLHWQRECHMMNLITKTSQFFNSTVWHLLSSTVAECLFCCSQKCLLFACMLMGLYYINWAQCLYSDLPDILLCSAGQGKRYLFYSGTLAIPATPIHLLIWHLFYTAMCILHVLEPHILLFRRPKSAT